jgi:arginyl-tRNA synthetase
MTVAPKGAIFIYIDTMHSMKIEESIQNAISHALADLGVTVDSATISLDHPADMAHGDYATGIALRYAKQIDKAPKVLAEEIVAALGTLEGVSKIEIAGPGFINFTLASSTIAAALYEAPKEEWGTNTQLTNEHVMIEYTSPNLFKPLHIGNLVGNVLGESIARLLTNAGAEVKRFNYPSDIGLTVAKGVWGLLQTGGNPAEIQALGEAYRTGNDGYENNPEAKIAIEDINKKLYESSDEQLNTLRTVGVETSRRHLDHICEVLGTKFDFEIFESEAAPVGLALVLSHVEDGLFEISDGATVFTAEQSGLHTRVFINSKGLPTYEAKDLGNFTMKSKLYPTWTRSIVVTGVEQQEYFKVVIAAIRKVFSEASGKLIEHIPTGFLTLTTGKMSSRKGNVLTGESLLADLQESANTHAAESRADDKNLLAQEVAVAAIKYQILKQSSGKNIVFDREKALSLEGDSGPYIQYAYARACAILNKAVEGGVVATIDASQLPIDLTRMVYRYPEIAARSVENLAPHTIANYALLLAAEFNSWYAQVQVLDDTDAAPHKVATVAVVAKTLERCLYLLGIPAPPKM